MTSINDKPQWTDRSDIQAIAREWEYLAQSMGDYPSRSAVIKTLMGLCTIYARGQGVRTGTLASLQQKGWVAINQMGDVAKWVSSHQDDWRYQRLVELGFADLKNFTEIAHGLREGETS